MSVDIANESGVPVDTDELLDVAETVMGAMGVNPLAELSVVLTDTTTMADLHWRWMQEREEEPRPTDVMAFPQDELETVRRPGRSAAGPALLGDVVLCPEVAIRQAATAGHTMHDELALLLTHGILHLLGYDHATLDEEKEMFDLQKRLLAAWRKARKSPEGTRASDPQVRP